MSDDTDSLLEAGSDVDVDDDIRDDVTPDEENDTDAHPEPEGEDGEPIEGDEDGDSDDQEPDFVEVEYEGKKYSVPADVKDALLRQSDYTRKTMEVADQRKALEAEREQFQQQAQMDQQFFDDVAEAKAIERQLEQYKDVDWNELRENDPHAFMTKDWERRQLVEQQTQVNQRISQAQAQAMQEQRQHVAKLKQEGMQVLQRDIPDWGPDKAKSIAKYAVDQGFSEQEISQVYDPRYVKVLNKARLYDQMKSKTPKKKPAEAQPVKTLKGKGSNKKDPNKMSNEEWAAWRNRELAKKGML